MRICGVEGTSVNVWGLMPRLSCDEARYASQSEAQGGFRREVQPRRQQWFLNRRSRLPFRTPSSARFPRDKDGSARRKVEPIQ